MDDVKAVMPLEGVLREALAVAKSTGSGFVEEWISDALRQHYVADIRLELCFLASYDHYWVSLGSLLEAGFHSLSLSPCHPANQLSEEPGEYVRTNIFCQRELEGVGKVTADVCTQFECTPDERREAQEWLEDFAAALQDCICPHAVSVVSAAQTFLGSSPKPLNPPDNKLDKCLPGVPGKRDSRDLSRHALPVAELSQESNPQTQSHSLVQARDQQRVEGHSSARYRRKAAMKTTRTAGRNIALAAQHRIWLIFDDDGLEEQFKVYQGRQYSQGETAFVLMYALVTIRILKAMPWRVIGIRPEIWVFASWWVLALWVLKPLQPTRFAKYREHIWQTIIVWTSLSHFLFLPPRLKPEAEHYNLSAQPWPTVEPIRHDFTTVFILFLSFTLVVRFKKFVWTHALTTFMAVFMMLRAPYSTDHFLIKPTSAAWTYTTTLAIDLLVPLGGTWLLEVRSRRLFLCSLQH